MTTNPTRDRLSSICKDAFYSARDNGGTMHTAADDAADAILAEFYVRTAAEMRGVRMARIDEGRAEGAAAVRAAVAPLIEEWLAEKGTAPGYPETDEGKGFAAASRLCADELAIALRDVINDRIEQGADHAD